MTKQIILQVGVKILLKNHIRHRVLTNVTLIHLEQFDF